MHIERTIVDAAQVLAEVAKGVEAMDVAFHGVQVAYRPERVVVSLVGAAAAHAELVWELLILEFRHAGWGYTTRFDNGIDQPRTGMRFDHPSTLTRY